MIRRRLISLIREAIREELSGRLSESEAKLALIEQNFAAIAVRVKEKQEQQKQDSERKPRTTVREQWGAIRRRMEMESGE